jgi:tetratricopeptide (TPR) repeat protein
MRPKGVVYIAIALVFVDVSQALRYLALEGVIDRCNTDGGGARAISACTELVRRSPINFVAYYNRGNAYQDLRDGDRPRGLHQAIDLNPYYAAAYNNRGNAQLRAGFYENAIADFTKAIAVDPQYALADNNRAWTFAQIGKPAEGLPDVEKSLLLQPADARALNTRGHILEALGKTDEVIADFRRSLARNPENKDSQQALKRLDAGPQDS